MKNHVRAFVNEGNDVSTTMQFQEALTSHGGVPGARVTMIQGSFSEKLSMKWPGISKLDNFEFHEEGVRAWRAYGVGEGKFFLWSKFKGTLCSLNNVIF